jgi:hypothetical protein
MVGLIIVVVIIGVGLVVFSSISRESQAYKDGFSAGGAIYTSDASTGESSQEACKAAEPRGYNHADLPHGDNATQWLKGCVDAFNTAQGDD